MPKTQYLWDMENDSYLAELDETGTVTADFTCSPEHFGRVVSEHRDGHTSHHHYDALGSTRALTDETGTVSDTFDYDAWGNEIERTGTTETPFRWNGERGYYSHPYTGYIHVRRRIAQWDGGRWSTKDTLGILITGINAFQYCYNTPITLTDPSGEIQFKEIGNANGFNLPGPCPTILATKNPFGHTRTEFKFSKGEKEAIQDARKGPSIPGMKPGFIQRVTIGITAGWTCGTLTAECCAKAGATQPMCACAHYAIATFTFRFLESFSVERNSDAHPTTMPLIPRDMITRECPSCRISDCCEWFYTLTVVKEVTGAYVPGVKASRLSSTAQVMCDTRVVRNVAATDIPDTYPQSKETKGKPLTFPTEPAIGVFASVREIRVVHRSCADATVTGYRSFYQPIELPTALDPVP